MNLTNLIFWSASVITGLAGVHNIDSIQRAIWKVQARIVYESRTETWGSPKFLRNDQGPHKLSQRSGQERN
ncbi:hypothetical protein B9G79_05300 [Bdellovibrio bacteriovorus]|uniref:Uncharacterized protein n=1 Tax=Bdellovibrio bacteriovorus TaxID=959 RepID=A0A1Z3N6D1_BDEBC|nr:hypothetical protein B9G79_05300 [Bdellovibrio bacteriovorus]